MALGEPNVGQGSVIALSQFLPCLCGTPRVDRIQTTPASVANLLSIHCEHTPQWACIRVRYRLCEQELVSSRRRFEPVSIITFKVSLRVRSQSGFLTVGPPGKTFATSWLNNFKNFGWVDTSSDATLVAAPKMMSTGPNSFSAPASITTISAPPSPVKTVSPSPGPAGTVWGAAQR